MQQISCLVSLRALHVVHLRNDDTCVWVMRETKQFLIDNLSHFPELKLEWVSIDDDSCAARIVRSTEPPKKTKKSKGKEKATSPTHHGLGSSVFPTLPLDAWDKGSDSSDDEDARRPTLEMRELPFSDVWGVKIFNKEITAGRL